MKTILFLAVSGAFLLRPASAAGQEDLPRIEIFAGYSHLRPPSSISSYGMNGWNASIQASWKRWLGFIGEVGGSYGSKPLAETTEVLA